MNGIPFGWAIDVALRHDSILFAPSLDAAKEQGLLADIDTLWLNRGYNSKVCRDHTGDLCVPNVNPPPASARSSRS
jgi:hypothetical protein